MDLRFNIGVIQYDTSATDDTYLQQFVLEAIQTCGLGINDDSVQAGLLFVGQIFTDQIREEENTLFDTAVAARQDMFPLVNVFGKQSHDHETRNNHIYLELIIEVVELVEVVQTVCKLRSIGIADEHLQFVICVEAVVV